MIRVYWAAQGVSFAPKMGNHHFLFMLLDLSDPMPATRVEFLTVSGFKLGVISPFGSYEDFKFVWNDDGDVLAVKNWLNRKQHNRFEAHLVPPPNGTSLAFVNKIFQATANYNSNTRSNPVTYRVISGNCATMINSILKAAGVSGSVRISCGEFPGIDWGEEAEMDASLFK